MDVGDGQSIELDDIGAIDLGTKPSGMGQSKHQQESHWDGLLLLPIIRKSVTPNSKSGHCCCCSFFLCCCSDTHNCWMRARPMQSPCLIRGEKNMRLIEVVTDDWRIETKKYKGWDRCSSQMVPCSVVWPIKRSYRAMQCSIVSFLLLSFFFLVGKSSIYFLTVTRSSSPLPCHFFRVRVLSPPFPLLPPFPAQTPTIPPQPHKTLRRHRFPPTLCHRRRCQGLPPLRRRPQQAEEEWGGLRGAGAELRVELRRHEVGVRGRRRRACIVWWVGGWVCVIE